MLYEMKNDSIITPEIENQNSSFNFCISANLRLSGNKPRKAKVGALCMAQNTNRTKLILMFEKMYFGIIF